MRILTLTLNPAVDASTSVRRVEAGAKLRCAAARHEPGGGGLNVARVLRELGTACRALYPCGGEHGALLRTLLDRAGLDHQPIPVSGATRQNLLVVEEGSSRQYRFTFPGVRITPEEEEALFATTLAEPADLVVASGSMPPGLRGDFLARMASALRERGTRLVVDTGGTALRLAARAGVYLLKPNVREFCALAGCVLDDRVESLAALARDWIGASSSEALAVSLGRRGALLATRGGEVQHYEAPPLPEVSAVGAGDSMVAGIVHSLASGKSLQEAMRSGVAAGAAAVLTPGSRLCRRADFELLLPQVTVRELAAG